MDAISGIVTSGLKNIQGLQAKSGITPPASVDAPRSLEELRNTSFKDLLLGSIEEVNMMQQNADKAVETLMTGGEIGTAEVLTAVQKADIAFKMMMQMRNKLVNAFQEIQNIRV